MGPLLRAHRHRAAGSPIEELTAPGSSAPLEVLRLVLVDGAMELRFCGARVARPLARPFGMPRARARPPRRSPRCTAEAAQTSRLARARHATEQACPARPLAAGALEALVRFMVETQPAGRLNHPNVVSVFDFGRTEVAEGSLLFLVMEYVTGRDLWTVHHGDLDTVRAHRGHPAPGAVGARRGALPRHGAPGRQPASGSARPSAEHGHSAC
jgi:hypothetical protein